MTHLPTLTLATLLALWTSPGVASCVNPPACTQYDGVHLQGPYIVDGSGRLPPPDGWDTRQNVFIGRSPPCRGNANTWCIVPECSDKVTTNCTLGSNQRPLDNYCERDGIQIPCPPIPAPTVVTEDRSWHLLTQSYGGTVTLLRDMTKHECDEARSRVALICPRGCMPVSGDIKSAECFQ